MLCPPSVMLLEEGKSGGWPQRAGRALRSSRYIHTATSTYYTSTRGHLCSNGWRCRTDAPGGEPQSWCRARCDHPGPPHLLSLFLSGEGVPWRRRLSSGTGADFPGWYWGTKTAGRVRGRRAPGRIRTRPAIQRNETVPPAHPPVRYIGRAEKNYDSPDLHQRRAHPP